MKTVRHIVAVLVSLPVLWVFVTALACVAAFRLLFGIAPKPYEEDET